MYDGNAQSGYYLLYQFSRLHGNEETGSEYDADIAFER